MSTYSITDVILAATTIIYTVGTFLLWISTKQSVRILSEQLSQIQKQGLDNSVFNRLVFQNSIYDAHREIWTTVISNNKFIGLLTGGIKNEDERITGEFIGTILINHCARIQDGYEEKLLDSTERDSFARDARYLFSFPLVRNRWKQVKKFHKKSFIEFVDSMID